MLMHILPVDTDRPTEPRRQAHSQGSHRSHHRSPPKTPKRVKAPSRRTGHIPLREVRRLPYRFRMTNKRSMFGSLEQRLQPRVAPTTDRKQARHVWLDSSTPALVTNRRRQGGAWEGLLLYIRDGEPIHEWVAGNRITTLKNTQDTPATS